MRQQGETTGFADSLREMQTEFAKLKELQEMEEIYSQDLADMVKVLQLQLDAPIPIPPEVLGRSYRAAYLGSEAVVVAFGKDGALLTRALQTYPSDIIVSIVQACAPELLKRLSEKRAAENAKAKAMEKVLRELQRTQIAIGQAAREGEKEREGEDQQPDEGSDSEQDKRRLS